MQVEGFVQPAQRRLLQVHRIRIGSKARRNQQRVEVLRRQPEHPRQAQYHGAPRLRTTGLDKTEMTR